MLDLVQFSTEQVLLIRGEASRILSHPTFATSERCIKLLRYLVEQTLSEPGVPIKERQVGHEVFGKPPDYDTSSFPLVRNAATETRKRLREYYSQSPGSSEVRIELAQGSYLLNFHFLDDAGDRSEAETRHPSEDWPTEAAPVAVVEVPERTARFPWLKLLVYVASILAAALLGFALAKQGETRSAHPREIATSSFWQPILESKKEVFISVGHADGLQLRDDSTIALEQLRFTIADLRACTNIGGLLEGARISFKLHSDRVTTFDDLLHRPVVLIGNFNNTWTARLASNLRYRYTYDAVRKVRGIEDSNHPGINLWEMPERTSTPESRVEYAIAERFKSPITGDIVISVSGLGAFGTQAASEMLTNAKFLESLPAELSNPDKNIQVILRIPIVDNTPGAPELLATYVW